ncbi:MAG: divalent metal cation transporter [Candidatus Nanopelagicaceae bacterium]|jgi:NRAMP (natural resistance-associated macrophage protein)-like metal ion transporter
MSDETIAAKKAAVKAVQVVRVVKGVKVPTISPRKIRIAALLAVMGPGMIAGLSDDDPAGITTYSQMGAKYGYRLLWVLVLSTLALILFQDLGARIGVVTRQGLIGLVRQKYGARSGVFSASSLILANIGTMTAEFAGIAAAGQLFGVSKYLSVPVAGLLVTFLVLRGSFGRVEKVFFILSAVFLSYVVAGFMARPDWGQAFHGMVVPSMPFTRDAVFIATATLGTTLAPWGLAFIQSYAVDKRLTRDDLKLLRVDVWTGSLLTGIIGFFVIITCAATLNRQGIFTITDASQAAAALEPLAGTLAKELFAIGLIGAALLAASILPLSTAYSVSDLTGRPAALDDGFREAPLFYGTFAAITVIAAGLILLPGAPLVTILLWTQVLNAVLLLPLLFYMFGIARDKRLMGEYRAGARMQAVYLLIIGMVAVCIASMIWFTFH